MRGTLHLLLGGAAAAALAGVGFGITMTVLNARGASRLLAVAMAVLTVVLVGWLLLAPAVRTAGSQLARLLLGVDVPELPEATDREGRVNGAVWSLTVLLVGGGCLFLLLLLVPAGIGLIAAPVLDDPLRIGRRDFEPTTAMRWLLVPVGLLLVAAAIAVLVGGVRLLSRWAPVWLRPTADEQLAVERERSLELARANALARDLHDSIGHALTAIGMQAEAGALDTFERQDAVRAFAAIRDVAHGAVGELDRVLGVLHADRTDTGLRRVAELDELFARLPAGTTRVTIDPAVNDFPVRTQDAVHNIVREAVTNALRHGEPPVVVRIDVDRGWAEVLVTNRFTGTSSLDHGRGLAGMAERARLVGGSVDLAVDGDAWRVVARLPRSPR